MQHEPTRVTRQQFSCPPNPATERWVLDFTITPGDPPAAIRVRQLLKEAARLGMRCKGVYNDVPLPDVEPVELTEGEP